MWKSQTVLCGPPTVDGSTLTGGDRDAWSPGVVTWPLGSRLPAQVLDNQGQALARRSEVSCGAGEAAEWVGFQDEGAAAAGPGPAQRGCGAGLSEASARTAVICWRGLYL